MGNWQILPYNAPFLPVHAALLRTGKVFLFAGSGNDPKNVGPPIAQSSAIWDVSSGTFTLVKIPVNSTGNPVDVFCAGHSFRTEGQLMIAGGTQRYDPFKGLPNAYFFDPNTRVWTTKPSMNSGRWYPTLLTLGSGRIFALAGLDGNGQLNVQPEIYSAAFANGWNAFPPTTDPSDPTKMINFPNYSHLYLMQDGRIFFSGGSMGWNNGVGPRILTLPSSFSQPIGQSQVLGLSYGDRTDQASSVLLPPAQDQKVMISGGGNSAVGRVAITDLTAASPAYSDAPPLRYARMHHMSVLLPDRTVFVCNGSQMSEQTTQSMLPAEIYNPLANNGAGQWTTAETQLVPRVYHSVALLLPDGRVVSAGGNPIRGTNELRLELYTPSYVPTSGAMFSRPVIQGAPAKITYGQTITITTPQAANIKWVSLIRPSANTHSMDTEQRLVDVPITARTATTITGSIVSNHNLAPPGYYMLFITDNNTSQAGAPNGIPSVASWTQLS